MAKASKAEVYFGQVVWASVESFPFWPGVIRDNLESDTGVKFDKPRWKYQQKVFVYFYNDDDNGAWVNPANPNEFKPFTLENASEFTSNSKSISTDFRDQWIKAVQVARDEFLRKKRLAKIDVVDKFVADIQKRKNYRSHKHVHAGFYAIIQQHDKNVAAFAAAPASTRMAAANAMDSGSQKAGVMVTGPALVQANIPSKVEDASLSFKETAATNGSPLPATLDRPKRKSGPDAGSPPAIVIKGPAIPQGEPRPSSDLHKDKKAKAGPSSVSPGKAAHLETKDVSVYKILFDRAAQQRLDLVEKRVAELENLVNKLLSSVAPNTSANGEEVMFLQSSPSELHKRSAELLASKQTNAERLGLAVEELIRAATKFLNEQKESKAPVHTVKSLIDLAVDERAKKSSLFQHVVASLCAEAAGWENTQNPDTSK